MLDYLLSCLAQALGSGALVLWSLASSLNACLYEEKRAPHHVISNIDGRGPEIMKAPWTKDGWAGVVVVFGHYRGGVGRVKMKAGWVKGFVARPSHPIHRED